MNSIQRRYVEVLQPGGHAFVGREHEFFNQAVGPAALGANDALHRSLGIEFNDRLGQIEINRTAALALLVQQARQFIHPFEFRNQRSKLLPRALLVAADHRMHLGVGHAADRADDPLG